ncbi:FecR family protein [Pedobacter nutrimenti]|uniref:FecR family protein n=1 Tax=Pedobacter nutrimenti TaxID=1241337 RepID=UPI00292FE93A|nr:FecR domain-containing protein [Pedobacter nutrimenti]
MDNPTPEQLLDKYFAGQCSPEEKATLESWYLLETENAVDELPEPNYIGLEEEMWKVIEPLAVPRRKVRRLWLRIAAAAAILLIFGSGLIYFNSYKERTNTAIAYQNINAGGNKAYLTLGGGQKLSLTDALNGHVAEQAGVEIIKTAKGELIYNVKNRQGNHPGLINTITTPRGGQWQIRLPDGSTVWLNSSSSLIYPSAFNNHGERKIELHGEAYFEVHKDPKHAFVVKTEQQEVRVLGTHFNISAYQEDHLVKTTLLEGSVQVTARSGIRILKPGQQSELSERTISVKAVQADDAVAWKNGYFMFNYEDLESVMTKVARWYDVELRYEDPSVKKEVFFGTISKYENISKVLNMLERTGVVKFHMDKKTIVISKK